ncbi:MAG: tRNA (N6-threonylcarbamoyladenosine(37)-N6)-methyltransferase TrmO [Nitrospiraceae bacterium]|nr:tRNA (N6-threonylcarbamoyladenosine(37)-N6)-methyltransferase TrmO [Nitrospiraceae bacterium]
MQITFQPIGTIHTPYREKAPYQPVESDEGTFFLEMNPDYEPGLKDLDTFKYIYVLYFIDRLVKKVSMDVAPFWAGEIEVGLFASRSPLRPNPIGLSIVKILKVDRNIITTSGLDVFDGTPLLDVKPYIKDLDSKADANYGWVDKTGDMRHLALHILGIPHEY